MPTQTVSTMHSTPVETVVSLQHSSIQPSPTSSELFFSSPSGVEVELSIASTTHVTSAVPTTSPSISPPPTGTVQSDSGTFSNGLPVNIIPATPLESETSLGREETEPPVNWPFIAGLVVGVILLVLIVIVFLLIIFVVSLRRGDEDSDKYSGDTVSDTLFNVVAASQQQRINHEERAVQACGE